MYIVFYISIQRLLIDVFEIDAIYVGRLSSILFIIDSVSERNDKVANEITEVVFCYIIVFDFNAFLLWS
jgi:hypothetical protein